MADFFKGGSVKLPGPDRVAPPGYTGLTQPQDTSFRQGWLQMTHCKIKHLHVGS